MEGKVTVTDMLTGKGKEDKNGYEERPRTTERVGKGKEEVP